MKSRFVLLALAASVLAGCQTVATGQLTSTPRPAITSSLTPEPTPRPTASAPRPTIAPTPTVAPTLTVAPTPTLPPATAFAFNLFEEGDFVAQHTFEWCVGASIQMAHNLVRSDRRNSYEDQQAMWELARANSTNSFRGANPKGWAIALEEIGLGPYELVSVPGYEEALRMAAAAIADTGRPAGLVMWRGRHAWVMSGFESIGDPGIHSDFQVTGVRVLDPLYPHGSGTWGPSPAPNALLSPAELATQFVVREPRRWSADLRAGYFLVLPVADES